MPFLSAFSTLSAFSETDFLMSSASFAEFSFNCSSVVFLFSQPVGKSPKATMSPSKNTFVIKVLP